MSDTEEATELLFREQERVLADPDLSVQAKLAFCTLLGNSSFRGNYRTGWLFVDTRWSAPFRCHLRELALAGYLATSSCGDAVGLSVDLGGAS